MDDEQKLEQQKAAAILLHAGVPYEPHKGPVSAAVMRGELGGNPCLFEVMEHQSKR